MKKKLITLSLILCGISLSSCISGAKPTSSTIDGPIEKKQLINTAFDLSASNYFKIDSLKTTEPTSKVLVVPIWLKDSSSYIEESEKEAIKENINKTIFGTPEETGWHSVKSFYEAESYNKFSISGEVTDWYVTENTWDYFDKTKDATPTLVKEVFNWWKSNNEERYKEFDSDLNGYIDSIILIYGGPNYKNKNTAKSTNMWAYTSWLESTPNILNPVINSYIWASYDFMKPSENATYFLDAHTYIHEFGHLLGLDDYYDYSNQYIPAAGLTMQDYNVCGHDPFSILSFGWTNPYVMDKNSTTVTIEPFVTSGDLILIPASTNYNNELFDEYLLVEYYTPMGVNALDSTYSYQNKYPLGVSDSGIRIWHVDARLFDMTNYSKKQISVATSIKEGTKYISACTNSFKSGDDDTYLSISEEFRNYRLLELVRRADYNHTRASTKLDSYKQRDCFFNSRDLFYAGDSFVASDYAQVSTLNENLKNGYFVNSSTIFMTIYPTFNNKTQFSWRISVDSISNGKATISISK